MACLLLAVLAAGPVACSPSVSDAEIRTASTRRDELEKEKLSRQAELKTLNEEIRALTTGYTGPMHAERMKKAENLREEKTALESIKGDLDGKIAHFTSETKRHQEALEKEKP